MLSFACPLQAGPRAYRMRPPNRFRRYVQRSELLSRKRQLQGELEEKRAQIAKTERDLHDIERELIAHELSSPKA